MLWLVAAASGADWSVAPMPIGDYSSDHGVGYGGYLLAVRREHPEAEDHTLRMGLQLFWSTGKYRNHWLQVDAPRIAGGPWSVEVEAGWEAWEFAPYVGYGNDATRSRTVSERFYTYDIAGGYVLGAFRRDLVGDWDAFATTAFRVASVDPYPASALVLDRPAGMDGGQAWRVGVGAMHDTRKGLPDPKAGHATELSVRVGQDRVFGATLVDRRFLTLTEGLVLANQLLVDGRRGEEPFWMAHIVGGSRWIALGGPDLLRGFPEGRFRGHAALVEALELRWSARTFGIRGHSLEFVPSPFVEAGRVWAEGDTDALTHLHADAGLGLRFIWDRDLVVRWDTAVGREEYADGTTGPILGVWFMFDHAF